MQLLMHLGANLILLVSLVGGSASALQLKRVYWHLNVKKVSRILPQ